MQGFGTRKLYSPDPMISSTWNLWQAGHVAGFCAKFFDLGLCHSLARVVCMVGFQLGLSWFFVQLSGLGSMAKPRADSVTSGNGLRQQLKSPHSPPAKHRRKLDALDIAGSPLFLTDLDAWSLVGLRSSFKSLLRALGPNVWGF